jgi:hypothetical protein
VSDESTAVLQGQLEQAVTGDAKARQRLLELTRDRLMRHARHFLHGRYARLEPLAQTDDVVQQLYVKILQNEDCIKSVGHVCNVPSVARYKRAPRQRAFFSGTLHHGNEETLR